MTQSYALDKAFDLFGEGAHAGHGVIGKRTDEVFFVGKKVRGDWTVLGIGDSFEQAFENAKEVK